MFVNSFRYEALVATYDEEKGAHHCIYEDGDRKWCVRQRKRSQELCTGKETKGEARNE
jgi:hypothetical protein